MKKTLLFVGAFLISAMSFGAINLVAESTASVDKGDGKGYKDDKNIFLSSYSNDEVKFKINEIEFGQIGCQYNSKNAPAAVSPASKQFIQLRKVDSSDEPKPTGAIYNLSAMDLKSLEILQYNNGTAFKVLAGNAADDLKEVALPEAEAAKFEIAKSDETTEEIDVDKFVIDLSGKVFFRIENGSKNPNYICSIAIDGSLATAIENAVIAPKAVKLIENGQLVIIRDGVRYNSVGLVIE